MASPLLCATKKYYFTLLSVKLNFNSSSFGEARWIVSEDVSVKNLLGVFITADANSNDTWDACRDFMKHLFPQTTTSHTEAKN